MRNRYYIVAANYDRYMNWLHTTRPIELLGENDYFNAEFVYVSGVSKIRGLSDIKGFILPGANQRPDYQEIIEYIEIIKSKNKPVYYTSAYQGSNNTIRGLQYTGIIIDELSEDNTNRLERAKQNPVIKQLCDDLDKLMRDDYDKLLGDAFPVKVVEAETGRTPPGTPGTN